MKDLVKNVDYFMIDHSIDLEVTQFPKVVQNTIKDLELYDEQDNWEMYDGVSCGLYALIKALWVNGEITREQFVLLVKKYGANYIKVNRS